MKSIFSARLILPTAVLCAVVLAATGIGAAAASKRASAAATSLNASLISRPHGTLAPGSTVSASDLGTRVFTSSNNGFALANGNQAQYPAATSNAGKSWKTDGPALHVDAAQAPLAVVDLGASSRKTIYAYGSGQAVDTTANGGKQWYRTLFNGVTMAVVRDSLGHLVAFVDQSSGKTNTTVQYVSKNGGRSWSVDTTPGGS